MSFEKLGGITSSTTQKIYSCHSAVSVSIEGAAPHREQRLLKPFFSVPSRWHLVCPFFLFSLCPSPLLLPPLHNIFRSSMAIFYEDQFCFSQSSAPHITTLAQQRKQRSSSGNWKKTTVNSQTFSVLTHMGIVGKIRCPRVLNA